MTHTCFQAPAGAGLVAAGRPGQADAGAKAGAGKRRANGEGPGAPVANMQQGGMLPGYGGPGDEASAAMYAEDMLLQEQFELRAADRKRGFGQMAASPDEREQGGRESSENEAAKVHTHTLSLSLSLTHTYSHTYAHTHTHTWI